MALKILTVASEAFPLAKTGGLGDAVSGMAAAIHAMGGHITVLLPAYRGVFARLAHPRVAARLTGLPGGDARLITGHCPTSGLEVILLDNSALYDRDGLYVDGDGVEYPDNAIRFAALCHAAARIAAGIPGVSQPNVLHLHDWHTGLTPLILRQMGVRDVRTVLTLHNIAFQGSFDAAMAEQIGIEADWRVPGALYHFGRLNFLHAGIAGADKVTAVSANYAREILTPQFGCSLEGLLTQRRADLLAIPNGIDTSIWNPATDVHLRGCHFDVNDLRNKAVCKQRLQSKFGLESNPQATLLAMGSRLTGQKMADVAVHALERALNQYEHLQVCVIGRGEKTIESQLHELGSRHAGRCAVHIGYAEDMAHLLHAGADMLLHGSRFEPFGLTPLYAMRYGTIPIGSKVGGMVDTITDPGDATPDRLQYATGILFEGAQEQDMCGAIDRAMALYRDRTTWKQLQRNAMLKDYSWERAAPAYLKCFLALSQRVPSVQTPRTVVRARSKRSTPALTPGTHIGVAI